MLRRIFLAYLACLFLVCLSTPNQAWPQQESRRLIRTLVEGERSLSRAMIEALRRVYANQETKLEFTLNTADPYDLRLIVAGAHVINRQDSTDFSPGAGLLFGEILTRRRGLSAGAASPEPLRRMIVCPPAIMRYNLLARRERATTLAP
jgi:hypothetical protein